MSDVWCRPVRLTQVWPTPKNNPISPKPWQVITANPERPPVVPDLSLHCIDPRTALDALRRKGPTRQSFDRRALQGRVDRQIASKRIAIIWARPPCLGGGIRLGRNIVRGVEMAEENLQKRGGVVALIGAATVVVGIVMFATMLSDYATGDLDPGESVAFLADNEASIFIWNLITLIVFSIVLVPLALALHQRLKAGSPAMSQTATGFGLIWAGLLIAAGMILNIGFGTVVDLFGTNSAQAESLWLAIDSVANGLSGGMEIAGPIWVLLVSLAGLRAGVFPKAMNYRGVVMAVAGLLTIVPALEDVGIVFGLGLIVWLGWVGAILLRDNSTK